MGLPTYVINFHELSDSLAKGLTDGINSELDLSGLVDGVGQVTQLVEQMTPNGDGVKVQKIDGFVSTGGNITRIFDKDVILTGITFSQSKFDAMCMDKWKVKILYSPEEPSTERVILDNVYSKDAMQHKYFENGIHVRAGGVVIIETPQSGGDQVFWADIEYLEFVEGASNEYS